jgi:hypothetical protein
MVFVYIALFLAALALAATGIKSILNYMADNRDGFGSDLKDLILGILLIDNALFALGVIYILKVLADK